jgi:Fe-Mn family superoxide dismutase
MKHLRLKPLPYDTHALEPHIGRETVEIHYAKHHAGYARKLKELIADEPAATASLEQLIRTTEGAAFDNAAQIWNHDFYWRSMHPDGGGAPSGPLNEAITRSFGGFERFRSCFLEAGTAHFGSGWLWLVSHRDDLRIATTPDADLPLRYGASAILCADLWEHAYYLDYRDQRASYLEAFIDYLANWEFAGVNWSHAAESAPGGGAPGASRRSLARPARLELETFASTSRVVVCEGRRWHHK